MFTIPHVFQFSAYHQHLYKHNHLHPSLELWGGLKKSPLRRQSRHCLLKEHWNCIRWSEAAVISPECHTGEFLFRSWTLLCLSLQRAKLIPRVLIPTAELLQMWLTQQSHFKINDECVSKYSFYTDDLLLLSTTGKKHTHTVYELSKLAKSVSITESDGVSLGIKF